MRFIVNGEEREFTGDPGISLLEYLKSVEGVPITNAGCSGGGRCGACTVEVDEKAVLSCRFPMEKIAGRIVSTTDAAGQLIQDIFSMALRKMGTPECHYCVPETVMKARLFLQGNPDPTGEESLRAVEQHLCHCIGHKKIARSILDAAGILKDPGTRAART
jgi:aerobic-type carbon monoxide dehydrogenase small subunit (CoxS/CutS family)